MSKFEQLEQDHAKVKQIEAELIPAVEKRDQERVEVQEILGVATSPLVSFGKLKFSRPMLVIASVVGCFMLSAFLVTPAIGVAVAAAVGFGGYLWVKGMING